jgi:hypothetical protein
MPAYAKKTAVEDQFGARRTSDGAILCNLCNRYNCNIADETSNPDGIVYLLNTDKAHLNNNIPHDVYCESCIESYSPKPTMV